MADRPARSPYHRGVSELSALQSVTDAALAYLAQDELLEELLNRITEVLSADTAAILLLDESAGVLRARAARGIEEEVERGVQIPVGRGFAGRIAAERRPIAIEDVDHADILNPILREKGIRSLLGVPLLVEGRVIGVLHVGSLTPREFTADETELLQLTGDRVAVAIEHTNLHVRERLAREAAEAASRRLESLQRITDTAFAYLAQDELLEELLNRITEVLSADTAAILLLNESAGVLRARAARGIEEEVERGVQIPVGRGFAGRIAAERRPIAIEDVDHADILNPILREKGIRSLLGVPLLVEGRVIGVLHVGSLTPREFTADETELLQLTGDRVAVAIEHARLYEQRRLAEALQHHLLPSDLSRIPGIELASRYLPASGESLGGDWYDAFMLSRGRIVVAVGDVVGHGIGAAAVMAQLRTALRAYAVDDHPPEAVVEHVNNLMWSLGPSAMTTLAYLVITPDEESLELVNAGHPPPLVIDPDGAASFLPLAGGMALGTSPVARYRCQAHLFPTGTTVALYTDGLVESRGRSIDEGLERLRAVATGHTSVDSLCTEIVERLVPEQRPDDVAMIAVRVPPPPERLSARWSAERESLVAVRQLLRRWLRARSATEDEVYDITVACQEACANAVEHAYRPGRDWFELEATYEDRRVRLIVRDHGRWRPPRGSNRGRGLPLMHALMERVDVEHTDEGTVVLLERTLAGAAA
jgi:GAF domain-containing protein/anti-sigma regulatory factor (Ser/Thr protein kinase)